VRAALAQIEAVRHLKTREQLQIRHRYRLGCRRRPSRHPRDTRMGCRR
jgi:hypothetical protein